MNLILNPRTFYCPSCSNFSSTIVHDSAKKWDSKKDHSYMYKVSFPWKKCCSVLLLQEWNVANYKTQTKTSFAQDSRVFPIKVANMAEIQVSLSLFLLIFSPTKEMKNILPVVGKREKDKSLCVEYNTMYVIQRLPYVMHSSDECTSHI